jgi:hypothetical protein
MISTGGCEENQRTAVKKLGGAAESTAEHPPFNSGGRQQAVFFCII